MWIRHLELWAEVAGQWVVSYLVIACFCVLAGLVYSGTDPKMDTLYNQDALFCSYQGFLLRSGATFGVQVPLYDF